ncbi:low density lipoprotein receptor adapter protein 1-B isoform X2 [Salmo salar]|uniref:Low density lipoprotein receptor adapter protein 1-B isoform X2 n=1 Tax=Salmo salar TaxID=8030 RepID=A0ABM3F7B7_SALSA|nr:low density lipoprotein receptor adapter protein 1-B isoform X2 [Salmo salar]
MNIIIHLFWAVSEVEDKKNSWKSLGECVTNKCFERQEPKLVGLFAPILDYGMDALKSAGRAIIRSPSLAKQSWGVGRHKKLPENWTDTRETLLEGMLFQLKYLGVTLVEQPKGEELSAAAVKRIVSTAKASGKKLQKVTLKVSPRGIILYDYASNQLIENISIYRISYCTADKMHDKVFAYIAQSQQNETLECHAYLCTKRKVAQAVTLTVAQAFRVAFEFWQAAKEDKEKRVKSGSDGEGASSSQSESSASLGSLKGGGMFAFHCFTEVATGNLLDLAEGANVALVHSGTKESEPDPFMVRNHSTENNNTVWELEDGLDEAFSSRSLDSFESYSDSLSLAITPRSWTLG